MAQRKEAPHNSHRHAVFLDVTNFLIIGTHDDPGIPHEGSQSFALQSSDFLLGLAVNDVVGRAEIDDLPGLNPTSAVGQENSQFSGGGRA